MALFQPARRFQGLPLAGTLLDRLLSLRRPRLAAAWSRDDQGRLVREWTRDGD
jgi:hypothetical protein